MRRILVPTDFSPTAEKAFVLAIDLAQRTGASVTLYHNYTPVDSAFVGTEKIRKEHNDQNEMMIVKRLERLVQKVRDDNTKVVVSTFVGHSPLVENIIAYSEQNDIDLIVMGTQGASGLQKTMLGSVAARVIQLAAVPLLLVPGRYEPGEIEQVVFLSDCHSNDTSALNFLYEITSLYHADLAIVHLIEMYKPEKEKLADRRGFERYVEEHKQQPHGSRYKIHLVETASIEETMQSLHTVYPHDVMAMLTHKKNWLQKLFGTSFTQNLAYVTTKPLLVIPGAK